MDDWLNANLHPCQGTATRLQADLAGVNSERRRLSFARFVAALAAKEVDNRQPAPPSRATIPATRNHVVKKPPSSHTRAEGWPSHSQATSTVDLPRRDVGMQKPRSSPGGPTCHRRIWSRQSNHRHQPPRPSRRPTATSPRLHTKSRRRRGSPRARSVEDLAPLVEKRPSICPFSPQLIRPAAKGGISPGSIENMGKVALVPVQMCPLVPVCATNRD
jgi:hypothetical protein